MIAINRPCIEFKNVFKLPSIRSGGKELLGRTQRIFTHGFKHYGMWHEETTFINQNLFEILSVFLLL